MCIVHQVGKINVKPADEQTDDMKAKVDIKGQSVTKSVTKIFKIGVTNPQKLEINEEREFGNTN